MEELYNSIFKRKSFHLFRDTGNETISKEELEDISSFYNSLTPLYPDIKTQINIVLESETTCKRGGEYCILMYSEVKAGYLQNIGYLGEMLDLYLVSRNIGTLWFGIGKVKETKLNNLEYIIMICVKKISDQSKYRKDMYKSKRKDISDTWEGSLIPGVSDICRFAPSACNSQPWHILREDNTLRIYRDIKSGKVGIMPIPKVGYYNKIDIGIYMCFLELCLRHNNIDFTRDLSPEKVKIKNLAFNGNYILK